MAEIKALIKTFDNSDKHFFESQPERHAHIRLPYKGEADGEFWSLGQHNRSQRRILLWRVPADNPYYKQGEQPVLKIPFLAFEDENIPDEDDVLLPIIATIMQEQSNG